MTNGGLWRRSYCWQVVTTVYTEMNTVCLRVCGLTCAQRLWFSHQTNTWSLWKKQRRLKWTQRQINTFFHGQMMRLANSVNVLGNSQGGGQQNISSKRSQTKLRNQSKAITHRLNLSLTYIISLWVQNDLTQWVCVCWVRQATSLSEM